MILPPSQREPRRLSSPSGSGEIRPIKSRRGSLGYLLYEYGLLKTLKIFNWIVDPVSPGVKPPKSVND
jgi:hypothetical protein